VEREFLTKRKLKEGGTNRTTAKNLGRRKDKKRNSGKKFTEGKKTQKQRDESRITTMLKKRDWEEDTEAAKRGRKKLAF